MSTQKIRHAKHSKAPQYHSADQSHADENGAAMTAQSEQGAVVGDSLDRQRMIAEAAYYRAAQRGFEPGHELDDWLAAEASVIGTDLEQLSIDGDAH